MRTNSGREDFPHSKPLLRLRHLHRILKLSCDAGLVVGVVLVGVAGGRTESVAESAARDVGARKIHFRRSVKTKVAN